MNGGPGPRRLWPALAAGCLVATAALAAPPGPRPAPVTPTLDQIVSLRRVASPAISPDGLRVAYTVRDTDWVANAFVTQVWLADARTGETRQLTRGAKSSNAPAWAPDGRRLAFGSERTDRRQVFVLDMAGGDAVQLTTAEESVGDFAWSPDGRAIACVVRDPVAKAMKEREQRDGEVVRVGEEHRMSHLWVVDVASRKARRLTSGPFHVGGFDWSPDGSRIAFDHRINPELGADSTTDLSVVAVADGTVRPLVTQPGPDAAPVWSPDGARIAFETTMASPWHYYANTMIAAVPAAGGAVEPLTAGFDEDCRLVDWGPDGIYFSALRRTWSHLHRLDPATRRVTRLAHADEWIGSGFSLDTAFATVAFVGSDATRYPEIWVAPLATMVPTRLTDMGAQVAGWRLGTSEVIRWTSRDGVEIEGVLRKPAGFRPGRRRPLIVAVHGGPTAVSRPSLFASPSVYPVDLWLARGALVLEPNYRGSAGYGAAFRALNVRNLGIGGAWDVWDDPGIYARTSPITAVRRASAPTLIQHGELDARVPTPNAYELHRALLDVGVPTRLVLYKGFGHGLNRPKAVRAALRENLEWFDLHLWGERAARRAP